MKPEYRNPQEFTSDLLTVLMISGTIGIALKFVTFQVVLNSNLAAGNILTGLFFPYFPNLLDSGFLILSILFLAGRIVIIRRRMNRT
jgi:hypothetical protein